MNIIEVVVNVYYIVCWCIVINIAVMTMVSLAKLIRNPESRENGIILALFIFVIVAVAWCLNQYCVEEPFAAVCHSNRNIDLMYSRRLRFCALNPESGHCVGRWRV